MRFIMKLKQLILLTGGLSAMMSAAYAHEVVLTTNQPATVSFQMMHQNQNMSPVAGEVRTISIDKSLTIPIEMQAYQIAGIKVLSINGHELPSSANQFNQPQQCSIAIDSIKTQGTIELTVIEHEAKCSTNGGVFG